MYLLCQGSETAEYPMLTTIQAAASLGTRFASTILLEG